MVLTGMPRPCANNLEADSPRHDGCSGHLIPRHPTSLLIRLSLSSRAPSISSWPAAAASHKPELCDLVCQHGQRRGWGRWVWGFLGSSQADICCHHSITLSPLATHSPFKLPVYLLYTLLCKCFRDGSLWWAAVLHWIIQTAARTDSGLSLWRGGGSGMKQEDRGNFSPLEMVGCEICLRGWGGVTSSVKSGWWEEGCCQKRKRKRRKRRGEWKLGGACQVITGRSLNRAGQLTDWKCTEWEQFPQLMSLRVKTLTPVSTIDLCVAALLCIMWHEYYTSWPCHVFYLQEENNAVKNISTPL